MSLRELIILLLGLAIIGIILRGLFVALQARRGQLRMAIDKNIPADVDLDALELAELPSGGARVVRRDGATQEGMPSKLERAALRAEALDLEEDSEAVPVLMDSVAVGHSDEPAGLSDEEKIAENTDPKAQRHRRVASIALLTRCAFQTNLSSCNKPVSRLTMQTRSSVRLTTGSRPWAISWWRAR